MHQKSMEGPFYKNFSCQMGDKFLGGAILDEGLMIKSCQGWGSFTNAFSSNLKTVYNLDFLAIMKEMKIKP